MPSRYRPRYRWQVDWNGSGRFDHARSDVTEDVRLYSLLVGSRPSHNGLAVGIAPASGQLILQSPNGRYDPDSRNQQVNETDLRARRAVRLLMDDVVAWRGRVAPGGRHGDNADAVFSKPLESENADELLARDRVLSHDGGTVEDLAAKYRSLSGLPLVVPSHPQQVGIVRYRGNWLIFLSNFGRFAGGWCIERMDGSWQFIRYHETPSLPLAATLDVGYEPHYPVDIAERTGHVRNIAELTGSYYFNDPNERGVARTARQMRLNSRQTFRVAPRGDAGFSVIEFTRTEVTPRDVAVLLSDMGDEVVVQSLGFAGPPREVAVTRYARVQVIQQATPLELEITEFDSTGVYGPKPLITPNWFPASYVGVAEHFKPWLRNLSQPPEHVAITYSEWQRTQAQSHVLRDECVPGKALDLQYYHEDMLRTTPVAALAVRLQGGFRREPLRTLFGVTRRSAPPSPLTVAFENVRDRSAQAIINVPSPAAETVFYRHRTS